MTLRPMIQNYPGIACVLLAVGGWLAPAMAAPPPRSPAGPVSEPGQGCPRGAVLLAVGSTLQARVDVAPPGTSFCIQAGTHRMQAIKPKDEQRFYGEPGAILNGSKLIQDFAREGKYWVATGQKQRGVRSATDECPPEWPRCSYPDAFFIDDRPLIHVDSKAKVKTGTYHFDYAGQKIYFVDNPTGKKVEASVTPYAFDGSTSKRVLVQGLIVEKYAPQMQVGAIGFGGPSYGWVVRDNEVRLNYALGISVGTKAHVVGNRVHNNGQMGVGCFGEDILFENNEIFSNGYFSKVDTFWEGGGAKCAKTNRLIVRSNHLYDNNGFGFWTDIDNINTLYEGNLVEGNRNGGLSHEISYAAVIRNNVLRGNGTGPHTWLWGGAIQIQNSQNVEVYGNIVDMTHGGNGICLIQQNRGDGEYGPYKTINNHVYRNLVFSRTPDQGVSGALADDDHKGMLAGNNRFVDNVYFVPRLTDQHWAWVDDFYDWQGYQRRSGQDSTSVVRRIASGAETGPQRP
ncbi:right-handed parallel beta-helix repeat-containing protein [Dankookia sp. GCM10030260]|uniref:right-handed parallel beta-helix repeat-containing protein n=1 Tax=Dankookia sp. GCM10030260 TaxID=3273390 RepID=UPI0036063248